MERIGIRELRQNVSAYLRRVEAGESIGIDDRGRPIAMIVPDQSDLTFVEQLRLSGELIPAETGWELWLTPPPPLAEGATSISAALADLRAEERY